MHRQVTVMMRRRRNVRRLLHQLLWPSAAVRHYGLRPMPAV